MLIVGSLIVIAISLACLLATFIQLAKIGPEDFLPAGSDLKEFEEWRN